MEPSTNKPLVANPNPNPFPSEDTRYILRIDFWSPEQLRNSKLYAAYEKEPAVPTWLRLRVRATATYREIAKACMVAWKFTDQTHSFDFTLNGHYWSGDLKNGLGYADFKQLSENRTCLDLREAQPKQGDKFTIKYNFGSGWEWKGKIEKLERGGFELDPAVVLVKSVGKPASQYPPKIEEEDDDEEEEEDEEGEESESEDSGEQDESESGESVEQESTHKHKRHQVGGMAGHAHHHHHHESSSKHAKKRKLDH